MELDPDRCKNTIFSGPELNFRFMYDDNSNTLWCDVAKCGSTTYVFTVFKELYTRPLSAPFLFRTSGKGTDMATPLGPEKYGRIDFSLGRWTTMGQNAPKLGLKHAKEQVELKG